MICLKNVVPSEQHGPVLVGVGIHEGAVELFYLYSPTVTGIATQQRPTELITLKPNEALELADHLVKASKEAADYAGGD